MTTILPLEQAARYPVQEVGGKAHNLGKLLQAGFAVPSGFVVLAEAKAEAIFPHLNDGLWAVRSSAAAEDSGSQSFAGQHASFLNVPRAEVPAKINACRASTETQAARAYRQGQNPAGMAVIVQQMVAAQAAGVAFTVDPTSGNAETIWVEMTAGSGEALVGGTAVPHSLRLARDVGQSLTSEYPSGLPIPAESIPALARLLLGVEKAFGEAQDIEWCFADGQFWLLQARPITTTHQGWTRANIGEVIPGVVTPLTWSVFSAHVTGQPQGNETALRLIGGRAHLNEAMLLRSFQWLVWADPQAVCKALGMETQPSAHRHTLPEWGASILFLLDLLGLSGRLEHRVRQFQQTPRPPAPVPSDTANLLENFVAWDAWTANAFRLHLYTTTYAVGAYGFLAGWLRKRNPDLAASQEVSLLQQLVASQSGGIGRELQQMAGEARRLGCANIADAQNNPAFAGQWTAFLSEYGERAVDEFELSTPRWHEDPAPVIALLERYLQLPDRQSAAPPRTALAATNRLQHGYARFVMLREAMKHEVICGYGALRSLVLQLGQQFVAQGSLAVVEDIFFLTKSEISQLASAHSLAETIHLRRAQWQRHKRPAMAAISGQPLAQLEGIGCSPGVIEGIARVVTTFEAGLTVQPDEILVVPHADPAWTPLFLCAGGVVAELGGFLSHSATVAREFGIPAVFNVAGATQHIQSGQRLRMDGTRGCIQVLI